MNTEKLRPFDDLIKEIEYNGEKFIPAMKIVQLCFNYNEEIVKNNYQCWINNSYDMRMWYRFETNILKSEGKKHFCSVGIWRDYSISCHHEIGSDKTSNTGVPAYNQVKIFKLLIEWGFI